MGARLSLNLVLAAVVAGLAWLWFHGAGEAPDPGLAVSELSPRTVETIQVEAAGRAPVTLRRHGDGWRLEAPLDAPADVPRVHSLLSLAAAHSHSGFRAAGNDLGQFGLEPARARVRFDGLTLLIGDTDPVQGLRYVLAGDQVHLLEDRWFGTIFGEPAAWVDPRPLAGAGKPVRIVLPDAEWRLEDGSWRRHPPDPTVSADAGTALADAWRLARALSVRALDPAQPWGRTVIVATAGEAGTVSFRLARSADAVLLGREDLGVQYRFLPRQGRALLGEAPPG